MDTIERMESEVRSYCRSFPVIFKEARGHLLIDEDGAKYIDFFAGAGVMNYGHNDPRLRDALVDYLQSGQIVHSLDMATTAKRTLLERMDEVLFKPRGYDYKVQFPGPTGTNAVEAALKLARKATGRHNVISFTNAFHGMTLGSLSVTGNGSKRAGAGVPLPHTTVTPFDGYLGSEVDTLEQLESYLEDSGSGIDKPAAVILETVQAEGGVNAASMDWLRRLNELVHRHDALLIVDDIQVGCGRTGPFFSFEPAGIQPDIVCLSKSLSGFGLPLALVLIKPELDVWDPGEHNGTFRGHNPAFVTAAAALDYWRDDTLSREVEAKAERVREHLTALAARHADLGASVRGRGLIQGIVFDDPDLAAEISQQAFERGLVIETAGPRDEVLKLLPPLTIPRDALDRGLDIIDESLEQALAERVEAAAVEAAAEMPELAVA